MSLTNSEILAQRLKAIRKKADLSQFEVELRTGIMAPHLRRIENGYIKKPRMKTLETLALVYEVPVEAILEGIDYASLNREG